MPEEDDDLTEIAKQFTVNTFLNDILPETISEDNIYFITQITEAVSAQSSRSVETESSADSADSADSTESKESAESAESTESESDSDPLIYRRDIQEALEELEFGRDIFQKIGVRLFSCILIHIFCWPNC